MPVWLTIALTAIGVLAPVGTLIALAVNHGRALERLAHLDRRVETMEANCTHCQDNTRDGDNALHGRVTELSNKVAAAQATLDGHGRRLDSLERRANGHGHS